jgi:FAD:protein FMN transferase
VRLFAFITARVFTVIMLLGSAQASAEWYSDEQAIMGTAVSVTLWHEDPRAAHQAIDAVMAEMRRIDHTFSPFKPDSELARVNREAGRAPVKISAELLAVIEKALYYSRISGGAFDISFASVGRHYEYRDKQQPAEAQRGHLLPAIDYRLIDLDRANATVAFQHPQMQIDLGGIAKGYAVDRGIALLRKFGIANATLSAGGDSRVLGDKRGEPWIVGIKNPRGQPVDRALANQEADRVAITLPLTDTAISTSGDYERFFIDPASGERVHHILNPRTGKSATGIASVSILGPLGFDTDPLSTAVFVLGVEQGLSLVNRLPGFDAIVIDTAGKVYYSNGLAAPPPK